MNKKQILTMIGFAAVMILAGTSSYRIMSDDDDLLPGDYETAYHDKEHGRETADAEGLFAEPNEDEAARTFTASAVEFTPVDIPVSFRGTGDNKLIGGENLNDIFNLIAHGDSVVRILQIGDSHVRGHYFPVAVRQTLEESFGSQATGDDKITYHTDCIASETGKNGIVYSAIGINGARASRFAEDDMIEKIAAQRPNIVIVSFGTNESHTKGYDEETHSGTIDTLLTRISEVCPDVQFLLTTPPGSFISQRSGRTYRDRRGRRRYSYVKRQNTVTSRVAANIVNYGKEHHIAVWDMYSIAGGEQFACTNWRGAGLMNNDRIHYTINGYRLQGHLLGEAFLKAYNEYVEH